MSNIKTGIYRHYKGKNYKVLFIALNSETLEEMVVYQAMYNSNKFGKHTIWVRPLKMFKEKIIIDNKKIPRFKFIGNIN